MSNTNTHYDYATAAFGSVSANAHASYNKEARTDALIQATLALAYEQRTANLIAWTTSCGDTPSREVSIEIASRLDLRA